MEGFWRPLLALLMLGATHSAFAKCSFEQLPINLRLWMQDEQLRITDIMGFNKQNQAERTVTGELLYPPEKRHIFSLRSYWVPDDRVTVYGSVAERTKRASLFRKENGTHWVRFFVHPDAESRGRWGRSDLYEDFLEGAEEAEAYCATATSSYRTLLVWQNASVEPFFVKLSLPKHLTGILRLVSGKEVVRSVGMNALLGSHAGAFPEGFSYLPEGLGVSPKEVDAGYLIRAVPDALLNKRLFPLYGLFGKAAQEKEPAVVRMAKESGLEVEDFLRKVLLVPFARMWVDLVVDCGFVPEAHGQNTLLELDAKGLPNGKFVFRDLDGMTIDLAYRKALGLSQPADLPYTKSIEADYEQNVCDIEKLTTDSLVFFTYALRAIAHSAGLENFHSLEQDLNNEIVRLWCKKRSVDPAVVTIWNLVGEEIGQRKTHKATLLERALGPE